MGRRVMDEQTWAREWVSFWGTVSATRILGWCVLTVLKLGDRELTRELVLREGWGSTATRYRNVAHLLAFRDAMEAKGYSFDDIDDLGEARTAGRLIQASA
jgi:hypothetical protein